MVASRSAAALASAAGDTRSQRAFPMGGGWKTRPSGHRRVAGWSTAAYACRRAGEESSYRGSNRAAHRRLSDDGRDGSVAVEEFAAGLGDAARQHVLSRPGAKSQPTDRHRIGAPAKPNHGLSGGAPARSQASGEFKGTPPRAARCVSNLPPVGGLVSSPERDGRA